MRTHNSFPLVDNSRITNHDIHFAEQPSGSQQQQQHVELTTTTTQHVAMVQNQRQLEQQHEVQPNSRSGCYTQRYM